MVESQKNESIRWRALTAILLAECFGSADAAVFFTALYPVLSNLLATTDTATIGWFGSLIIATFMCGWGCGSLFFGFLADLFGPVRIMAGAIALYSIATALCALSHSWADLAFYRFFVGLGLGAQMSVGIALMGEYWPSGKRLQAMSALQTSFRAGRFLLGLFNLGFGALGWRALFFAGVLPILLVPYFITKIPEPSDYIDANNERKLLQKQEFKELTHTQKQLLTNPFLQAFSKEHIYHTALYTLIAAAATVGYWVGISWIPAWINELTHGPAVAARAAATMYSACGGVAGCILSFYLISRFGWRHALIGGMTGAMTSSLALFCLTKTYSPLINIWALIIGFCAAIPFVVISVRISEVFPHNILGTTSGIVWSVGRFCAALAALCAAPITTFFRGSFALSAAAISLVYIVGLIATYLVVEEA